MKISRSIWVLLANGIAVFVSYLMTLIDFFGQDNGGTFWFHFPLRAIVPVLGILLEFFGSRFAKWVNVGYFIFVAVVILA